MESGTWAGSEEEGGGVLTSGLVSDCSLSGDLGGSDNGEDSDWRDGSSSWSGDTGS